MKIPIKQFFSSKVGWTFVAFHFIAVVYAFWGLASFEAGCGPFSPGAGWIYIAGTGLHWIYESVLMKILLIVDISALVIAEQILNIFGAASWCFLPRTWIFAILGLLFASFQWYVTGWMIQRIFGTSRQLPDR